VARGIRYVSYSRPGYGGSSRRPDRAVADCAADTAAILAHLGVDRCYTVGASGGGPHALACAALLADQVLACATVAGVGPFGVEGLDFLAGMGRENQEEFGAALAGPGELRVYLEQEAQAFADVTGEQVAAALGDLVSALDVAALTGDFAAYVAASFRQALANGIWGWFDDDLAFTRPWRFDPASIGVPVVVWQGGQDRMVPFAHGQWLAAHLPTARARLLPRGGPLVDRGGQVRRGRRRAGRPRSQGRPLKRLAIPLAIRLLLRGRPRCDGPVGRWTRPDLRRCARVVPGGRVVAHL
jgi:pimeloyl-ACP methyl ester carboxylesterase